MFWRSLGIQLALSLIACFGIVCQFPVLRLAAASGPEGPKPVVLLPPDEPDAVSLSPDDKLVAVAAWVSVYVWKLPSLEPVLRRALFSPVIGLRLLEDDRLCVVGRDGYVAVYSLPEFRILARGKIPLMGTATAAAFWGPGLGRLVLVTNRGEVKLWDVGGRRLIGQAVFPDRQRLAAVAIVPDRETLLVATEDGILFGLDLPGLRAKWQLDVEGLKRVTHVAWMREARFVVVSGKAASGEALLAAYRWEEGKQPCLHATRAEPNSAIAVHPVGTELATASGIWRPTDGQFRPWPDPVRQCQHATSTAGVMAWTHCGRYLFCGTPCGRYFVVAKSRMAVIADSGLPLGQGLLFSPNHYSQPAPGPGPTTFALAYRDRVLLADTRLQFPPRFVPIPEDPDARLDPSPSVVLRPHKPYAADWQAFLHKPAVSRKHGASKPQFVGVLRMFSLPSGSLTRQLEFRPTRGTLVLQVLFPSPSGTHVHGLAYIDGVRHLARIDLPRWQITGSVPHYVRSSDLPPAIRHWLACFPDAGIEVLYLFWTASVRGRRQELVQFEILAGPDLRRRSLSRRLQPPIAVVDGTPWGTIAAGFTLDEPPRLAVLRLPSGKTLNEKSLGAAGLPQTTLPTQAAIAPNRLVFYVCDIGSSAVLGFDMRSGRLVTRLSVDVPSMDLPHDALGLVGQGDHAVVHGPDGQVFVYCLVKERHLGTLWVLPGPSWAMTTTEGWFVAPAEAVPYIRHWDPYALRYLSCQETLRYLNPDRVRQILSCH